MQNINAWLLDYRPASAPNRSERSHFQISLDIIPQPDVDSRIGDKQEPIDPPDVVPRLRLGMQFKNGLVIGGTFVPELEYEDYQTEQISLDLGYRFKWRRYHLAVRASFSDGEVDGPITDADTEDHFTFSNKGLDLSMGRMFGRFHLYGFLGAGDTETTLDVKADGSNLENSDTAIYGGLGVSLQYRKFTFTLEQNATDDYLKHLIFNAGYRF